MDDTQREPLSPEFLAKAQERINKMMQKTNQVTADLGLPKEASIAVARLLFGSPNNTSDKD